ncbi:hypothetical protein DUNSADRAFT_4219 [Dunaliella salina]|uniref:Uncharacterized protein n=1 Tax=Dunaliella salina TaxID=3046 RepID=A0ABQ7GSE0_DUNSA|nr:hypothetical protein DUNSADRAFT_4219 [Dunaliella salina]|eukprot:KAF5837526.1 hypothetical protein DUNSADRAFT_4219 [Dunaliella salina]
MQLHHHQCGNKPSSLVHVGQANAATYLNKVRKRQKRRSLSTGHPAPALPPFSSPPATVDRPCVSRRVLLGIPVWVGPCLGMQLMSYPSPAQAAAAALAVPVQCPTTVSNLVTKTLRDSLASAIASCPDMRGVDYRGEVQSLLKREVKYAFAESEGRPDQADLTMTGAVQHKVYDLVSYISWKVVAAHVQSPDAQAELCRKFARSFLAGLWPNAMVQNRGAADEQATELQVYGALSRLLEILQENGYLCRYQIIWDEQPGTWPQDWMEQPVTVEGRPPSATEAAPEGLGFQIKLYQPADLEGSIALRSEEEAFWPSTVPNMITLLLEAAGYQQAISDTYFYQDRWQGPKSWTDQLLLKLGDPLEQVGIDFYPTTLVMDWQISPML